MLSYSEFLKTTINNGRKKIEEIERDIEKIRTNRNYTQEYINNRIHEYMVKKEDVINTYRSMLLGEYNDYLKRLQKSAENISGNAANIEDLALLNNKYIKLSQEEFDVLVNRHKGNNVMLNALSHYAAEHYLSMSVPYFSYEQKRNLAYDYCCQCIGYLKCSGLQWTIVESSNYFNEISERLPE